MELSKTNLATIFACKKGYKILNGKVFTPKGKELKLADNYKGYPKIAIRLNKKSYTVPIHKIVAYQKFGNAMFDKGVQVRHLNGNKWDFSFDNIEIGTQSDNRQDIPAEKRKEIGYKVNFERRKLSKEQADEIRKTYLFPNGKRKSMLKIAIEYGVSRSAIKNLIHNETYLR